MSPTPSLETPAVLWPKIEHVRIGMLTTTDSNGHLISRPMTNQRVDTDGRLWFFTSDESSVSHNISAEPKVNVSFVHAEDSLYVSVSGHAEQIRDKAKITELWNPLVAAWFPAGIEDPHLVLIKVCIESAEYWDSDASKMTQLLNMTKAALSGHAPEIKPGEHGRVIM